MMQSMRRYLSTNVFIPPRNAAVGSAPTKFKVRGWNPMVADQDESGLTPQELSKLAEIESMDAMERFEAAKSILGRASKEEDEEPFESPELSFLDVGATARVSSNLSTKFGITKPTSIQAAIFPALHSHSDIVLKDMTGSGKSLGLLAAALSKKHPFLYVRAPEGQKSDDDLTGWEDIDGTASGYMGNLLRKMKRVRYVTTLIIVPTPELALQLYTWSRALLSGIRASDIPKHVQCLVPHSSLESQLALLTSPTDGPPRMLISTPRRMMDVFGGPEPAIDLSYLQTLIIDEVDAMVRVIPRYSTLKHRNNMISHPTPLEVFMRGVVAIRRDESELSDVKASRRPEGKASSANQDAVKKKKPPPLTTASLIRGEGPRGRRLQVVLCSATVNKRVISELERVKNWVREPVLMDGVGDHGLNRNGPARADNDNTMCLGPKTVTHHCLVVDGVDVGDSSADIMDLDVDSSKGAFQHKDGVAADDQPRAPFKKSNAMAIEDDSDVMLDAVKQIYDALDIKRGILCVAPQISVMGVVERLKERGVMADRVKNSVDYDRMTGITSDAAEADAAEPQPSPTHPELLSQGSRLLVVTENFARGLDLPDLTHVIILGPQSSAGSYLHMSGRVGRFGNTGTSITVLNGSRFESKMRSILNLIGVKVKPLASQVFGQASD